jgi:AP-1 complex subunit sigma 1/2
VDKEDNELYVLEVIHHFVEILDRYFGNVCELDLIFNFHKVVYHRLSKAYYLLDEILIGGFIQEPSKKVILKAVQSQDALVEEANDDEQHKQ